MSIQELLEHNIVLYNEDFNYIKAAFNIGMGILAYVRWESIGLGLRIVYRNPNLRSQDPRTFILKFENLVPINKLGYNVNNIQCQSQNITELRILAFNNYQYYNIADKNYELIIPFLIKEIK